MAKFAIHHSLPVTRLVHISMGNWKDDKDLIIHLCDDITYDTTTKANTSYWHSRCGKNMDYAEADPREHTIREAVIGGRGVKFCPRCGTQEQFLEARKNVTAYDHARRMREDAEREAKQVESHRKWESMCAVLKDEVADVLANRPVVSGERNNEFVYQIVRNGVTYNVTLSIREAGE